MIAFLALLKSNDTSSKGRNSCMTPLDIESWYRRIKKLPRHHTISNHGTGCLTLRYV